VKDKKKQTQTAYKASKDIYDDVLTAQKWWAKLYINLFWGVDDFEIAEQLLEWVPDTLKGRLLDVPVGTAVFTADKYKKMRNAEIIALDYSEEMLAKASARFKQKEINNVTCIQGDVGDLPFKTGSMDIVLTMNGFHAFPDKEKALFEMLRVLKNGGQLIGSTFIEGAYHPTDFVVRAILSRKGWFNAPFYTKDELKNVFKKDYRHVEILNKKAIALFKCTK